MDVFLRGRDPPEKTKIYGDRSQIMKKRIWKIILWILHFPLWSLAIAGISLIVLFMFGIQTYVVMSGSMEPTIRTGGVVMVNSHKNDPETGDVITYSLGETNVTHRVTRVLDEGLFETKGDANTLSDAEEVTREQILGTVCFSVPYLGYFIAYLKSYEGLRVLGAILLLNLCLCYWIEKREEDRVKSPVEKL